MNMFSRLVAAAFLMSGGTYVMAQQDNQQRTARPLPKNTSKSPQIAAPLSSTEGVGIGPPSAGGSAAPDNANNKLNQKKREQ